MAVSVWTKPYLVAAVLCSIITELILASLIASPNDITNPGSVQLKQIHGSSCYSHATQLWCPHSYLFTGPANKVVLPEVVSEEDCRNACSDASFLCQGYNYYLRTSTTASTAVDQASSESVRMCELLKISHLSSHSALKVCENQLAIGWKYVVNSCWLECQNKCFGGDCFSTSRKDDYLCAADPCSAEPCGEHGVCINRKDGFVCNCPCSTGTTGTECQLSGDSPCCNWAHTAECEAHGGVCVVDDSEAAVCSCPNCKTGLTCGENLEESCLCKTCPSNKVCVDALEGPVCSLKCRDAAACLLNGGKCKRVRSRMFPKCICDTRCQSGHNCELVKYTCDCLLPKCAAGAECVDTDDGPQCTKCPCGKEGPRCSDDVEGACCGRQANKCGRHGTCVGILDGTPQCSCDTCYTGTYCQSQVESCECRNPCRSPEDCTEPTEGEITCSNCPCGYSGNTCSVPTFECCNWPFSKRCQLHGRCEKDRKGNNICKCDPCYRGAACQFKIRSCKCTECPHKGNVCRDTARGPVCTPDCDDNRSCSRNGGMCVALPGRGAICRCGDRCHYGSHCEKTRTTCDCLSVRCAKRAKCIDDPKVGPYCDRCPCGRKGRLCEEKVNECCNWRGAKTCSRHGKCVMGAKGPRCACKPCFRGEWCEERKDTCDCNNVCHPQIACDDSSGSSVCTSCPCGFTGPKCDRLAFECCNWPYAKLCSKHGRCELGRSNRSPQCICDKCYHGPLCEQRIQSCSCDNPCPLPGKCVDEVQIRVHHRRQAGPATVRCLKCPCGYYGDLCENFRFEPCNWPYRGQCDVHGTIVFSKHGTLKCVCDSCYEGALCEQKEKSCACDNPCGGGRENCVDSSSGPVCRRCSCGYSGDNCEIQTIQCCNWPSSEQCAIHSGRCVNTAHGPECKCTDKCRKGRFCEKVVQTCECNSPCKKGITCTDDPISGPRCSKKCPCGLSGLFCSVPTMECCQWEYRNKCEANSGQCHVEGSNFHCVCDKCHEGYLCELTKKTCECAGHCKSRETCIDSNGLLTCQKSKCPCGYEGSHCSIPVYQCCNWAANSKCISNGGTCEDTPEGPKCVCSDKCRYGQRCQKVYTSCECHNPCGSPERCTDVEGDVQCRDCPCGFTGRWCDQPVYQCCNWPFLPQCELNGKCVISHGEQLKCVCDSCHKGPLCENVQSTCDCSNPCEDGEECEDSPRGPMCTISTCPCGWAGPDCETQLAMCCSWDYVGVCHQAGGVCVDDSEGGDPQCLCSDKCREGDSCQALKNTCECASPCPDPESCKDTDSGPQCIRCGCGYSGPECRDIVYECCNWPYKGDCERNGGTCTETNKYPECQCDSCHEGPLCNYLKGTCECTNPCLPTEVCKDMSYGPICKDEMCPCGRSGPSCKLKVQQCCNWERTARCEENGGHCRDTVEGPVCECRDPCHHGSLCQHVLNTCLCMSPCDKDGDEKCTDTVQGPVCTSCPCGLGGRDCSEPTLECCSWPLKDQCEVGGICSDDGPYPTCTCKECYTGSLCEEQIYTCGCNNPCGPETVCVDDPFGGTPVCEPTTKCGCGYEGLGCYRQIEECCNWKDLWVCEGNGGQCTNGQTGPQCICPSCREGPLCAKVVETCECSEKCPIGTSCHETVSGTVCSECPCGLEGPQCNLLTTECCNWVNKLFCEVNGRCVMVGGLPQCICKDCHYGPLCQERSNTCACTGECDGSSCVESVSGPICTTCECGFSGEDCRTPVARCCNWPYAELCSVHGHCSDDYGVPYCVCKPCYEGIFCENYIAHCDCANPCEDGTVCKNSPSGPVCEKCPCGYTGHGCLESRVECCNWELRGLCELHGECSDNGGYPTCLCHSCYQGQLCDTGLSTCACSNVCPTGSNCQDTPSGAVCENCPCGWEGDRCNRHVPQCCTWPYQSICSKHGQCSDAGGRIHCVCSQCFTGELCETALESCECTNPCPPGSVCQNGVTGSPVCSGCPCGTTGHLCDVPMYQCCNWDLVAECTEHGRCEERGGYPQCTCDHCYHGPLCRKVVNTCECRVACPSGTSCKDTPNGAECQECECGWAGDRCEVPVAACCTWPYKHLCEGMGQGVCHDDGIRPQCICGPCRTGPLCQTDVISCDCAHSCPPGSQCEDTLKGPVCQGCPCGTTGDRCEVQTIECCNWEYSNLCRLHGTCVDPVSQHTHLVCKCDKCFTGLYCQERLTSCECSTMCPTGSTCVDGPVGARCTDCPCGLSGDRCHQSVVRCCNWPHAVTCSHHGHCVEDRRGAVNCQCDSCHEGPLCETARQTCECSNSCPEGTKCMDTPQGYRCRNCPCGFEGPRCEVPVQKCCNWRYAQDCEIHGHCSEEDGAPKCVCDKCYHGRLCERRIQTCDCSDTCPLATKCLESAVGIPPHCEPCRCGFEGDRCELPVTQCCNWEGKIECERHRGTCVDRPHTVGPQCVCPECFYGPTCSSKKRTCLCDDDCPAKSICHDVAGSQHVCKDCPCGLGGRRCQSTVDECCSWPHRLTCEIHGTCVDSGGISKCVCDSCYKGPLCEQVLDNCECSSPCPARSRCRDSPGGPSCSECPCGYTGRRCEQAAVQCCNWPYRAHCESHGKCEMERQKPVCVCDQCYEGLICEKKKRTCLCSDPCRAGSRCKDSPSGPVCEGCPCGYTGPHCEHYSMQCCNWPYASTCHSHGSCMMKLGRAACVCDTCWEGPLCEKRIQSCDCGDPCPAGSRCVSGLLPGSELHCEGCPCGKEGPRCDQHVSRCCNWDMLAECENHGRCEDGRAGPVCVCSNCFSGVYCEHNADQCECNNPCHAGSQCKHTLQGPQCTNCPCGFDGPFCQNEISECCNWKERGHCERNGGKCIDADGPTCVCVDTCKDGKYCQIEKETCACSDPCGAGVCRDTAAGPECQDCPCGLTGPNCEISQSLCCTWAYRELCERRGVCSDKLGTPVCTQCEQCYEGPTCNKRMNTCACSNPCTGQEICEDSGGMSEPECLVACSDSTGSEFTLMFMENKNEKNPLPVAPELEVYVSSADLYGPVNVHVFTPRLYPSDECHFDIVEKIPGMTSKRFLLPACLMQTHTGISNKAIKVVELTGKGVVVYAISKRRFTVDSFLCLPDNVMGKEYVAVSYSPPDLSSEFAVVCLHNDTIVTIRFSTMSHAARVYMNGIVYNQGDTLTLTLQQYDTLQVQSSYGDLTGTSIKLSRPGHVYSGNVRVSVPSYALSRDHLVEELLPVTRWGREYVVVPIPQRGTGDYIRVVTGAQKAVVNVRTSDTNVITHGPIHPYSYEEIFLKTGDGTACYISSDVPVFVAHFSASRKDGSSGETIHDPSFITVVPIELYSNDVVVNTGLFTGGLGPPDQPVPYANNLVLLVVRDQDRNGILIDKTVVGSSLKWAKVPQPTSTSQRFYTTSINIEPGNHIIQHYNSRATFMAYAYSSDDRESYGHPIKINVAPCERTASCTPDSVDPCCTWSELLSCELNGKCESYDGHPHCACGPCHEGYLCLRAMQTCECSPDMCPENTECIQRGLSVQCEQCECGWRGQGCREQTMQCCNWPQTTICSKNGGFCQDAHEGPQCVCGDDCREGPYCQKRKNTCNCQQPCKTGRCRDRLSGPVCEECDCGYKGTYCEQTTTQCCNWNGRSTCERNGGACIDDPASGPRCQCGDSCKQGYVCERDVYTCECYNPCVGQSTCIDTPSGSQCTNCPCGKTGAGCTQDTVDCCTWDYKELCAAHGKCTKDAAKGTLTCACDSCYTGKFCEIRRDSCECSNPCHPPELCEDDGGTGSARCVQSCLGSTGSEFTLMFMENKDEKNLLPVAPELELYISSAGEESVLVRIFTPALLESSCRFDITAEIYQHVVRRFALPHCLMQTGSGISNRAIVVKEMGGQEIVVYTGGSTTDGYLALPDKAMGKDFVVVSTSPPVVSQFAIVVTEDSTVAVTLPSRASVIMNGATYNTSVGPIRFTLHQYGTVQVQYPGGDLTGTRIQLSSSGHVYSGDLRGAVHQDELSQGGVIEELVSTEMWGSEFVLVSNSNYGVEDYVRVVTGASQATVKIYYELGVPPVKYHVDPYSNIQEQLRGSSTGSYFICSENSVPIFVAHFSPRHWLGSQDTVYKSSFVTVAHTDMFTNHFVLSTPQLAHAGSATVTLVIREKDRDGLSVDWVASGDSISWVRAPQPSDTVDRFYTCSVLMKPGSHVISHIDPDVTFMVYYDFPVRIRFPLCF